MALWWPVRISVAPSSPWVRTFGLILLTRIFDTSPPKQCFYYARRKLPAWLISLLRWILCGTDFPTIIPKLPISQLLCAALLPGVGKACSRISSRSAYFVLFKSHQAPQRDRILLTQEDAVIPSRNVKYIFLGPVHASKLILSDKHSCTQLDRSFGTISVLNYRGWRHELPSSHQRTTLRFILRRTMSLFFRSSRAHNLRK